MSVCINVLIGRYVSQLLQIQELQQVCRTRKHCCSKDDRTIKIPATDNLDSGAMAEDLRGIQNNNWGRISLHISLGAVANLLAFRVNGVVFEAAEAGDIAGVACANDMEVYCAIGIIESRSRRSTSHIRTLDSWPKDKILLGRNTWELGYVRGERTDESILLVIRGCFARHVVRPTVEPKGRDSEEQTTDVGCFALCLIKLVVNRPG